MSGWTLVPENPASAWTPVPETSQEQYAQDVANRPGVPKAPVPSGLQGPPEGQPQPAPEPTMRDKLINRLLPSDQAPPEGGNTVDKFMTYGSNMLNRGIKTAVQPIMHPVDTLEGMAEASPAGGMVDAALGRENPVQRQVEGYADEFKANPMQAATDVGGDVLGMAAQGAALKSIPDFAGARNRMYPQTSEAVVPAPEQSARALTKTFAPSASDAENLTRSLQSETGNIKDFAQRNNNPLNTQQEFTKAAKGAADEAKAHFEDNFLKPNADMQVSTPANYQGKTIGEGHRATISQIDERIGQINDQLRPSYAKGKGGQVQTALANEADLRAEGSALTDLLNQNLAKATGVPVEDVAQLRQRYGKLYSIADEGQYAVNQRSTSAQKASEGRRDIPMSTIGTVAEGLNKLRGGPQMIADRMMQDALKGPFQDPYPLPQIPQTAPTAAAPRVPLAQQAGVTPTSPSFGVEPTPQSEIDANANRFQTRSQGVQDARTQAEQQAEANRIAAQNEFQRSQELQESAQKASAERSKQADQARIQNFVDRQNKPVAPRTHQFSKSAWQQVYPNGDVEAAAEHARNSGFDVTE